MGFSLLPSVVSRACISARVAAEHIEKLVLLLSVVCLGVGFHLRSFMAWLKSLSNAILMENN